VLRELRRAVDQLPTQPPHLAVLPFEDGQQPDAGVLHHASMIIISERVTVPLGAYEGCKTSFSTAHRAAPTCASAAI
jgi:hypothetical protein